MPAQLVPPPRARYLLVRERHLPGGLESQFTEVASWRHGSSRYRLLRLREAT